MFYENFLAIEQSFHQNPKQIANSRVARDELDAMLWILEEIISYLPDLIHQKWQYNSISDVMKRLLHPDNTTKLRKEAIALFLLWMQALQENCGVVMRMLYASLVPGFPNAVDKESGKRYTIDSIMQYNGPILDDENPIPTEDDDTGITTVEVLPLIPMGDDERQITDQTRYYIEVVLEFMVTQARALSWKDPVRGPGGFTFLWDLFKEFYLPHMFQNIESMSFEFDLYCLADGKTQAIDVCEQLMNQGSGSLGSYLQNNNASNLNQEYVRYVSDTGSVDSELYCRESLISAKVSTIKWLLCFIQAKESEISNIYHTSMIKNRQKLARRSRDQLNSSSGEHHVHGRMGHAGMMSHVRRTTEERDETDSGYSLPVGGDAGTLHRHMQRNTNDIIAEQEASIPNIHTGAGDDLEAASSPVNPSTLIDSSLEDSGIPPVTNHYSASHMTLSSYMVEHYPEVLKLSSDDIVRATVRMKREA